MDHPVETGVGVVVRARMAAPSRIGLVPMQALTGVPGTRVVAVVEVGPFLAIAVPEAERLDTERPRPDPAPVRDEVGDRQRALHHRPDLVAHREIARSERHPSLPTLRRDRPLDLGKRALVVAGLAVSLLAVIVR